MDKANDPLLYAQKYSELHMVGTQYLEIRDLPQLLKEYVNGTTTLDYGCGPGRATQYLKSLGLNIDAVDINEHMIEIARQQDPSGSYTTIKSGEIPKDDNYYDMVYAGWVLVHADSKQELHKICSEIGRVLKVGGTFIAVVNSDDTFGHDYLSVDYRFDENKNLTSGSITKTMFKVNQFVVYSYYWTEEDYREALEKAGLTVLCIHKPLGRDGDGYSWINEKERPVVSMYIAQKLL